MAGSSEVQSVVANLEKRYDEYTGGLERRSLLTKNNDELPDAEELGAAVEAYLATRDGRDGKDGESQDSGEEPDEDGDPA